MVALAAERGYEHATIAQVAGSAGVSRASFYAHFSGKEDCFLAALDELHRRLHAEVARSIEREPTERATAAAVDALIAFAERDSIAAKVLSNEALAAGPRVLDARDEALVRLAALIEHAYRGLAGSVVIPDLPAVVLLGAVQRLLASRLRDGERSLRAVREELLEWVASYAHRAGEHRWRTLTVHPAPARSRFVAEAPLRAPPPLSRGRARRSTGSLAENRSLRIVFAAAETFQREGYPAASVAAVTRRAGVDGRVFYELFADKQDVLRAVHELCFQCTMSVTAGAFFAAREWPQQIWEAGRAFTQCLEQNPLLARASLLESHAGGAESAERFEDLIAGFTIFLQEGYQYRPRGQDRAPSALALQAIAAASVELLYCQARSSTPQMAQTLPQLAYLSLAAFLGPVDAGELIEQLMRADSGAAPARPPRG